MSYSDKTFARSSSFLLIIGAGVLAAILLSSLFLGAKAQVYFKEVMALREARAATVDLALYLRAAESGQRGFVLTRDRNFLAPYLRATERMDYRLQRLRDAYRVDADFSGSLTEIENLIQAKLREMQTTVELGQGGDFDGALAIVRNSYGRGIMDRLGDILGAIASRADVRLEERIGDLDRSVSALRWFTIGGGIVIMILVGGAIAIVAQHVRALHRIHAEVEEFNASLEEKVDERTDDLIQANREIQRYAYIVSHDLRAPLVNVMGFTSEMEAALKAVSAYVLADGGALSEDQVRDARLAVEQDLPEALDFIRSSTRKMDGLINAILKISRDGRRELKPERIDLGQLFEATAATIRHQVDDAGGSIDIAVGDARSVVTDRFSLEQIFGNLFDNAVKYRHPDRALKLSVRTRRAGRGSVFIEVEDNGRGIAPEDHERIFELFRRSGAQDRPGDGIGLAHVRSLVRNLGGEITVASILGSGTTFTIRLPADLSHYIRSIAS